MPAEEVYGESSLRPLWGVWQDLQRLKEKILAEASLPREQVVDLFCSVAVARELYRHGYLDGGRVRVWVPGGEPARELRAWLEGHGARVEVGDALAEGVAGGKANPAVAGAGPVPDQPGVAAAGPGGAAGS
jgi:hypothetical protein